MAVETSLEKLEVVYFQIAYITHEKHAFINNLLESYLIGKFGRVELGTGTLLNGNNGLAADIRESYGVVKICYPLLVMNSKLCIINI